MSIKCREDLAGTRTDSHALGEVFPANDAIGVDKKFSGAGDVSAFWPAGAVEQTILLNRGGLWIGQAGELEPHLLRMLLSGLLRIRTDRHDTNAASVEVGELLLETP